MVVRYVYLVEVCRLWREEELRAQEIRGRTQRAGCSLVGWMGLVRLSLDRMGFYGVCETCAREGEAMYVYMCMCVRTVLCTRYFC